MSIDLAYPARAEARSHLDPLALISTDDLAALLQVSPITLRIWRLKGRGPRYLKLGRSVKYRRGDIEVWLQSRCVASTSEVVP